MIEKSSPGMACCVVSKMSSTIMRGHLSKSTPLGKPDDTHQQEMIVRPRTTASMADLFDDATPPKPMR